MANDAYVQIPPDSTGKQIDESLITTSVGTVYRQRIVPGDDAGNLQTVDIVGGSQISQYSGLGNLLQALILEVRSVRFAILALDKTLKVDDFDPDNFSNEANLTSGI